MKEILYSYFGTRIYLPVSAWIRRMKRARKVTPRFIQRTRLPEVRWGEFCKSATPSRLCEPEKQNGNVRISELAILCSLARDCGDKSNIVEIGTFDGRTAINLALNSPPGCHIYTLDLPPDAIVPEGVDDGERHLIENRDPGYRIESNRKSRPDVVTKITRLFGNSATFDWLPYEQSCSLVFVDGSHAYDYVRRDSEAALRLIDDDGVIVWHDYGVWEDVTRALEDLERDHCLGLCNIYGTSLVIMKRRKPLAKPAPAVQSIPDRGARLRPAGGLTFPATVAILLLAAFATTLLMTTHRLSEYTFETVYAPGGVVGISAACIWLGIAAVLLSRWHNPGWQTVMAAVMLSIGAAVVKADWVGLFAAGNSWNFGNYLNNGALHEKAIAVVLAACILAAITRLAVDAFNFFRKGGFLLPAGQLLITGLCLYFITKLLDQTPLILEWVSNLDLTTHAHRMAHALGEGLELAMSAIFLAAVLWHGQSRRQNAN